MRESPTKVSTRKFSKSKDQSCKPQVSHNQNPVFKWSTQNHASRIKKGGFPQPFLARGLSLTNLHQSPSFDCGSLVGCFNGPTPQGVPTRTKNPAKASTQKVVLQSKDPS